MVVEILLLKLHKEVNMKWAIGLLGILTLPLLFNLAPLEVLRLKTFDALGPQLQNLQVTLQSLTLLNKT